MTFTVNTLTTYQAVGNREDLSDMIYRIDPTDTPFMSGIEKEKATAVNHEWQTQALAAASSANAQLEGDDPTMVATTPTVRLGNLCQISYKVAQVSSTQQAVSTFTGRSTAIEEAKSKKIVASVDAYESDFGKLKVVASRFQRPRDVLVLEMDKWSVAYLNGRNMTSIQLAKTGDSDRCQILAEYALVARNEKASGGVFANTTS